jgi:hypothetical protein
MSATAVTARSQHFALETSYQMAERIVAQLSTRRSSEPPVSGLLIRRSYWWNADGVADLIIRQQMIETGLRTMIGVPMRPDSVRDVDSDQQEYNDDCDVL